jgi:nitroreductase
MEVYEAIRSRRSVRRWADRPIPDEVLRRVLEAGRLAPSARNLQEWKFLVVRAPELRAGLADAAKGQAFVGEAPAVIVGCAVETDHVMTCGQLCYPIDVAIALDHMTLAAAAEGLGTCWIGAFHEDKVKAVLGIPDEVRVVSLLPIGYPGGELPARPRKPFDEIVLFDRWHE